MVCIRRVLDVLGHHPLDTWGTLFSEFKALRFQLPLFELFSDTTASDPELCLRFMQSTGNQLVRGIWLGLEPAKPRKVGSGSL